MSSRKLLAGWRPSLLVGLIAILSGQLNARTFLIDFGPNNTTDGNVTPSGTPVFNPGNGSTGVADTNGNFWNNVIGAGNTGGPLALSYANLIDTTNASSKLALNLGPGWKSNGKLNGGLLNPTVARLGNFAIPNATCDYLFVDGANATATMQIDGLDPAKLYNFRIFATRAVNTVRDTIYTVSAGNGIFTQTLRTSGVGIGNGTGGDDGDELYDGNNRSIISFNGVQADSTAQISLRLTAGEGNFAYIGIMEISEGDPAPPIVSKTLRVDFGRTDGTNGSPTASPDTNGKYWNNFTAGGTATSGTTISNLVTTTNVSTGFGITLTTNFLANGRNNGGLLAPSAARLGELAIGTATEDYFFLDSNPATSGTMKLTGLNPLKLYDLRLFGTRNVNTVRRTTYTATAGNGVFSQVLQTSGAGLGNGTGGADGNDLYDGNNRSTVTLGALQPDGLGQISLQVAVNAGAFAYLGIMEIVEGVTAPGLPPVALGNDIDRWVSQDLLDPVQPGGVLFVGSSSIRRWETLAEDFSDYRIVQRGFGGSQFSDLIPQVNRIVTPYQPSAIVVFEGTNDIRVGNKTGETVFADFQTFVSTVHAQLPDVPICYLGITPVPSFFNNPDFEARRQTANSLISNYCASNPALKLHFFNINTFFDNLHESDPAAWATYFVDDSHFNRAGYAQCLTVVRPALEAVLPPNKTFTANPDTLVSGEKLFFDFGPTDGSNGDRTLAPDVNGNRWNNWYLTNGGVNINAGEHLPNLVRSTGTGTGIRMIMTGGFQCNGKLSGGLFAPQPSLLGELAVETATEDFFYSTADDINNANSDDIPGGFMLEGLNPALAYEIRFLGSRSNAETRITKYTVSGQNRQELLYTTSGTGISSTGGDTNDDDVAVISGVRPDAFGQVFIDLTLMQGSFAYINAMEVIATNPSGASAYDTWRSGHFTAGELADPDSEATVWGSNADPDGDGSSNLMEYATGSDPRSRDSQPQVFALESNGTFFSLTYRKNLAATDVEFQVESADDLVGWGDVADSLLSTAAGIETRKATVPTAGSPKRWLRLKVQLVPGA